MKFKLNEEGEYVTVFEYEDELLKTHMVFHRYYAYGKYTFRRKINTKQTFYAYEDGFEERIEIRSYNKLILMLT